MPCTTVPLRSMTPTWAVSCPAARRDAARRTRPRLSLPSRLSQGRLRYAKFTPVATFSLSEIGQWAGAHLAAGSMVFSDGLACFGAVAEAGCAHQPTVVGARKPRELPQFKWVNTMLGNLKRALSGSFHAFKFKKYASGYLAEFTYRFNRRFELRELPTRLLVAAAGCGPRTEWVIRTAEDDC
ncbi:MAG: IS1595 family transposase [Burkholderiaceae bacterium]|nr:MAG: IS1595 family transposase [Burkholderiaceae bacterium]